MEVLGRGLQEVLGGGLGGAAGGAGGGAWGACPSPRAPALRLSIFDSLVALVKASVPRPLGFLGIYDGPVLLAPNVAVPGNGQFGGSMFAGAMGLEARKAARDC